MRSNLSPLALWILVAAGCGSSTAKMPDSLPGDGSVPDGTVPDRGGADGGGSDGGPGFTGVCCLNDAFYACATKAAFDQCMGFDVAACHAMCAPDDFNCHMKCDQQAINAKHDPSACTRDASKDGQCAASCVGTSVGSCTLATDCGFTQHCVKGSCYDDKPGQPCSLATDCGTNGHCTNDCCYADAPGNPCSLATDCGPSSSCVAGICN
jgi:hypothetical protein